MRANVGKAVGSKLCPGSLPFVDIIHYTLVGRYLDYWDLRPKAVPLLRLHVKSSQAHTLQLSQNAALLLVIEGGVLRSSCAQSYDSHDHEGEMAAPKAC